MCKICCFSLCDRLLDIFFTSREPTKWFLDDVWRLIHDEKIEQRRKIKARARTAVFLAENREKLITQSDGCVGLALDCGQYDIMWAMMEKHWTEGKRWKLSFLIKIISDEKCPEAIKRKVAMNVEGNFLEKSEEIWQYSSPDFLKGVILILEYLPPDRRGSMIEKFIGSAFSDPDTTQYYAIGRQFGSITKGDKVIVEQNKDYRKTAMDFMLQVIELVPDSRVRHMIARRVIESGPRNDVLHRLATLLPEVTGEAVAIENGMEEAIMRLVEFK